MMKYVEFIKNWYPLLILIAVALVLLYCVCSDIVSIYVFDPQDRVKIKISAVPVVFSLYRIRFSYSDNHVVHSRIALVRGCSSQHAKNRFCKWFLLEFGPRPDFCIRHISKSSEFHYVILADPADDSDSDDLPPDDEPVPKVTVHDTVNRIGDFDDVLLKYDHKFV